MSAITLEQAQAQLAALLAAQASNMSTVSIAGRSVSYRSMGEITDAINYWTRMVNVLQRQAAGINRHGYRVADFRRAP